MQGELNIEVRKSPIPENVLSPHGQMRLLIHFESSNTESLARERNILACITNISESMEMFLYLLKTILSLTSLRLYEKVHTDSRCLSTIDFDSCTRGFSL
jgi:hypothetical protein